MKISLLTRTCRSHMEQPKQVVVSACAALSSSSNYKIPFKVPQICPWPVAQANDLHLLSNHLISRQFFTHTAVVYLFSSHKKNLACETPPKWLPIASHGACSLRRVTTSLQR